MNPDEPTLPASHETIYTALYALPRGQLRAELIAPVCDRPASAGGSGRGAKTAGAVS